MIYLGESDSWRGRSLYLSILETLRKSGVAGATVTRAIAGFGAHSRIRTTTSEILSLDLPIVISVIETPANVDRVLALVSPMVREGLITVEDVEIVKYTHRYLQPLPADLPVSQFMSRSITSVTEDTLARPIVELLLGKLFKALPVVDVERRVVGIITDGALTEIVKHEVTGMQTVPQDPVSLADCLERLFYSPDIRRKLGDSAREWVSGDRTWVRNAARYKDAYARLGAT